MLLQPRQLALAAALAVCWLGLVATRPVPDASRSLLDRGQLNWSATSLVQVDFYGESLCPDCQHMVLDILQPMFQSGVSRLMALRYIAYGNVRGSVHDSSGIRCQHGEEECLHNRFINCAQQAADNEQDRWFPYVECLATHMGHLTAKRDACAEQSGFDAATLTTCAEGEAGAALERVAGEETEALSPKHTFVPWIVVNGVPLGSDFENLDRYVCAASDPHQRPDACYAVPAKLATMFG